MFESLKKKLSSTVGKITDKLSKEEEEAKKREDQDKSEAAQKAGKTDTKKAPKSEIKQEEKSEKKKKKSDTKEPEQKDSLIEEPEPSEKEKKGLLSFVRHKTISEKDVDDILFELEMSLLEGDVALEVAEEIINSVKEDLVGRKIKRKNDVSEFTKEALKNAISKILEVDSQNIDELIQLKQKQGEPLKIMFVGINGTGKTTTIAKIATHFIEKGYKPVMAASDTFRAGAIEQLTHHADKIGVKIIKHKKGADPAAVAFDAVEHAKAQGKELVFSMISLI